MIYLNDIKTCRRCGETKEAKDFYKSPVTADGLQTYCKKCTSKVSNSGHTKRIYGLEEEDYQALLDEQEGCCYICKKPESRKVKGTLARLAVDHCHRKGHVRRLLCSKCNTGLGMFKDSPELLRAAADYLEENSEPRQDGRSGKGKSYDHAGRSPWEAWKAYKEGTPSSS